MDQANGDHCTISAGQWDEFVMQFRGVLALLRQIASVSQRAAAARPTPLPRSASCQGAALGVARLACYLCACCNCRSHSIAAWFALECLPPSSACPPMPMPMPMRRCGTWRTPAAWCQASTWTARYVFS